MLRRNNKFITATNPSLTHASIYTGTKLARGSYIFNAVFCSFEPKLFKKIKANTEYFNPLGFVGYLVTSPSITCVMVLCIAPRCSFVMILSPFLALLLSVKISPSLLLVME